MYRITGFAFVAAAVVWAQPCFAQCSQVYDGRIVYLNGQAVYIANGQPIYSDGQPLNFNGQSYEVVQANAQVPAQGQVRVQPNFQGTIPQSPWFADPAIRQQFKWNDQQFDRLNTAYQRSWTNYQKDFDRVDANLTPEQRRQRMAELQGKFYSDFATSTNDIITDPQQRQRYNQLYLQYRGYGAFDDPMVSQKLNLTAEQRQKLGQFNTEWSTQMGTLGQTYQTDRESANRQFQQMQTQMGTRLNSVLTPEQQQTWRDMVGNPYSFQPNVYFQGSLPTPKK